ncbi:UDP-N-acetylglucosamine diphosphorylase/glucosamine-1-phosphate N-acetyltransferase [Pseudomaricurvus alkylphenolicus]|uniref:bifunctional UDP-N-acetylglucosamine diphosphorylase/glucosamine-1-phosphate N-acetyltransferase GlmU n=1 Tax=Pseudomaricurvus alkylphenolicus TaxID=1306991 RepID=UPI001420DA48|nr:bifunctional UDP-N-acetylglucosamine diphosphorylase/glucosamine-1-phosphate N-acetyltransferase GlmU [Pseudomaricurvus alkylphenolicus]NIB39476.1 UDP-N-acetylglucosamine diphosphorylase/glucosamine-1-phosphate N-acetyltransferase [Pseudomaricurvus alkylphenolicus]
MLDIVVLAAGQGTRMKSSLPKVLHPIGGKPMLGHVLDSARQLGDAKIHLVVGHGSERVQESFAAADVDFVSQTEQLGTGHAVQQALPVLRQNSTVLILYGDVPLTPSSLLKQLVDCVSEDSMGLLTVNLKDPTGYGRIIRNDQHDVVAIVEQKDATEEQLVIREGNTGMMAVASEDLKRWLPALSAENAQGEYYLTDIIAMAQAEGKRIVTEKVENEYLVQGVNNRHQQAQLERYYQLSQAEQLMQAGVTLLDPERFDCRGSLSVGRDVVIDVNCVFEGDVILGDGVVVGANCVIGNCSIGTGTQIKPFTSIDGAQMAEDCDIGPYARVRPGTVLAKGAKLGNFVETKKANIGEGSKVNHLTYIGDSDIGSKVNVGAGTITCNYDGVNKSKTTIGDGAFIGSNSSLVAPVTIGAGATVGAGSTVTSEVPDDHLGVARGKQRNIKNWKRPVKQ